jgi:hypothetical protein
MSAFDRELRQLYQFQCGYCGTNEVDIGAKLEMDHFQPQSKGGSNDFSNLVYCCPACNRFKGDYWNPSSPLRLLHPQRDKVSEHFREGEDGFLISLTETGRFHIQRLQLNRPQLVLQRLRRKREAEARRTYMALLRRFTELEQELAQALAELERLRSIF